MSLAARVTALAQAVGADIKDIRSTLARPVIGTALPVTGQAEGTEFDFFVTGEDALWPLRLYGGAWRCKGGASLRRKQSGATSPLATTGVWGVDTTTNLTIPLAGTYDIEIMANGYTPGSAGSVGVAAYKNGTALLVSVDSGPSNGFGAQMSEKIRVTLAKNDVIALAYWTNFANSVIRYRSLVVSPVSFTP